MSPSIAKTHTPLRALGASDAKDVSAPWVDLIEDRSSTRTRAGARRESQPLRRGLRVQRARVLQWRASPLESATSDGNGSVPAYDGPFLAVSLGIAFRLGSRLQLAATATSAIPAAPAAAGPTCADLRCQEPIAPKSCFELPLEAPGRALGGYRASRTTSCRLGSKSSVHAERTRMARWRQHFCGTLAATSALAVMRSSAREPTSPSNGRSLRGMRSTAWPGSSRSECETDACRSPTLPEPCWSAAAAFFLHPAGEELRARPRLGGSSRRTAQAPPHSRPASGGVAVLCAFAVACASWLPSRSLGHLGGDILRSPTSISSIACGGGDGSRRRRRHLRRPPAGQARRPGPGRLYLYFNGYQITGSPTRYRRVARARAFSLHR